MLRFRFIFALIFILLPAAVCTASGHSVGGDKEKVLRMAAQYLEQTDQTTSSKTGKIIPVTVIVTGLLDAGFDTDEPMVRLGLEFLQNSLAQDGYVYSENGKRLDTETEQVRNCLQSALFPIKPECSQEDADVAALLAGLQNNDANDEAVARAVDFVSHVQKADVGEMIEPFIHDGQEYAVCHTFRFALTCFPKRFDEDFNWDETFLTKVFELFRPFQPFRLFNISGSGAFLQVCTVPTSTRIFLLSLPLEAVVPAVSVIYRDNAVSSIKTGYAAIAQTNCRRE
jgi:hypothetical protein